MVLVLIFIFCVFFFKQKTAYEMRISDWSSDVCSSDLIVADIRPPEPWNSGALAPISGDRLRLGPERTVIFGDVADAPQPQPRQPARSKKIGRASCRERVCQYV